MSVKNKRPTNASLQGLFVEQGGLKKPPGRNHVLVRTSPGVLAWVDGTGVNKGSFVGKAGTPTRSRKGNISRKLNGSREYHEEWWNTQVVAY